MVLHGGLLDARQSLVDVGAHGVDVGLDPPVCVAHQRRKRHLRLNPGCTRSNSGLPSQSEVHLS
jgi:hypothetical protein